ncbi:hypothetical protein B5X24_HaOG214753 [Helicoverpa armigera]|uniref:Uncharacterized protein n=1 Tax=Helicoverpa armigera TaxID=29058 RepID=A0A2W1BGR5_HELAM|nr:hypothetical protein B5X24_HaOG214753 [Helicoverpa armigera]
MGLSKHYYQQIQEAFDKVRSSQLGRSQMSKQLLTNLEQKLLLWVLLWRGFQNSPAKCSAAEHSEHSGHLKAASNLNWRAFCATLKLFHMSDNFMDC